MEQICNGVGYILLTEVEVLLVVKVARNFSGENLFVVTPDLPVTRCEAVSAQLKTVVIKRKAHVI